MLFRSGGASSGDVADGIVGVGVGVGGVDFAGDAGGELGN
jgi:hypothetical protein